jgi:hypothetical protein
MNTSKLMYIGIAAWYIGGALYFNEFASILFISGLLLISYFTYFGQPFSIHDDMLTIYLSMIFGFISAMVYGKKRDEERIKKEETEGIDLE